MAHLLFASLVGRPLCQAWALRLQWAGNTGEPLLYVLAMPVTPVIPSSSPTFYLGLLGLAIGRSPDSWPLSRLHLWLSVSEHSGSVGPGMEE